MPLKHGRGIVGGFEITLRGNPTNAFDAVVSILREAGFEVEMLSPWSLAAKRGSVILQYMFHSYPTRQDNLIARIMQADSDLYVLRIERLKLGLITSVSSRPSDRIRLLETQVVAALKAQGSFDTTSEFEI